MDKSSRKSLKMASSIIRKSIIINKLNIIKEEEV